MSLNAAAGVTEEEWTAAVKLSRAASPAKAFLFGASGGSKAGRAVGSSHALDTQLLSSAAAAAAAAAAANAAAGAGSSSGPQQQQQQHTATTVAGGKPDQDGAAAVAAADGDDVGFVDHELAVEALAAVAGAAAEPLRQQFSHRAALVR